MIDPWKHRSEGIRCKTCMWSVMKERLSDESPMGPATILKEDEPIQIQEVRTARSGNVDHIVFPPKIGRCRRHAPTMNGYPVIYENDWCGDHKLDETKI